MNTEFRQRLEITVPAEIHASDVMRARGLARLLFPREWQAESIEILRLRPLYAHWQALNWPENELTYWPGDRPPHPPFHEIRSGWTEVRGYVLKGWNSVRDEYWAHSPSKAWDGIRRTTYSIFIDWIRLVTSHYAGECRMCDDHLINCLRDYKITVIDDLSIMPVPA